MKTKTFLNIFPQKTAIIKKPEEEKIKILIDYREKNSLVPSSLINLGFDIEFKELKVADYLVNNTAIERKTIIDFLSSMKNRRLLNQLDELQQYEKRLLIIEGFEEQELYNDEDISGIHPNSIRGFLLSITLKHKIPIIFTKNEKDTARFISVIAKKKTTEPPLNVKKKTLNKKERLQYILEGFPGIGPKAARKLLEEFKTLQNIINASQEELKKIIGKKAEVFKLVEERY